MNKYQGINLLTTGCKRRGGGKKLYIQRRKKKKLNKTERIQKVKYKKNIIKETNSFKYVKQNKILDTDNKIDEM